MQLLVEVINSLELVIQQMMPSPGATVTLDTIESLPCNVLAVIQRSFSHCKVQSTSVSNFLNLKYVVRCFFGSCNENNKIKSKASKKQLKVHSLNWLLYETTSYMYIHEPIKKTVASSSNILSKPDDLVLAACICS